jgi:hypothetical protein
LEVVSERVEEGMAAFAAGASEKAWSMYWEVDHGLVRDHPRECWVDGDGHRYDGSRFGIGSRSHIQAKPALQRRKEAS